MAKRKYTHKKLGRCYGQHNEGIDELAHESPREVSGYKTRRKNKKIMID